MNKVEALLEQLAQREIALWASDDGKLHFRAPEGVFDRDLRQKVTMHKQAIIDVLQSRRHVPYDERQRWQPFPLTDVQAAYFLGGTHAWQYGGTGCHGYAELEIKEPQRWQAADYQRAWAQVVDCHDMLRCHILADGQQQIVPDIEVPLEVVVCHGPDDFLQAQKRVRQALKNVHYNPEIPPLIRVQVVTMQTRATLHVSVNLLITDFIGIEVLLNDLFWGLTHPDHKLSPPSLSFREYVTTTIAQRQSVDGQKARQRAHAYWQQQTADFPSPMSFAADIASETDIEKVCYKRRSHIVSAHLWQQFIRLAREKGVTPTSVAIAILSRIARRYGAEERHYLTLTVLDRKPLADDIMRVVGDFTSTLLVPLHSTPNTSTLALASSAQQQLFASLDYSALSGIDVLRMLPQARTATHSATPIVMTSTLGAGTVTPKEYRSCITQGLSQTPQVLLDVQLSDYDGGMSIVWDTREGGYPDTVLDAAFADFCTALTTLADNAERWEQPPTVCKEFQPEIQPIAIEAINEEPLNLLTDIRSWVRQGPSALACIHEHDLVNRAELWQQAGAWRDYLRQQGCQHGDFVLIALPPSITLVAAQLGSLRAGASFVPIDPQWPQLRQDTIAHTLRAEKPDKHLYWITEETIGLASVALSSQGDDALIQEDDLAYVIFTSGSTGKPKGVPITHKQALTTLHAMQQLVALNEQDRILAISRASFDLAIFNVFGLLGVGGSLVIPTAGNVADPESWAKDISRHHVTLWNSVPAQLQLLLESGGDEIAHAFAHLRAALISGDWIPVALPDQLWSFSPDCRFFALGGATEASIWSNWHEVRPDEHHIRSIPYGRPLPGQSMKVVNDELEEAVPLQVGQIVIAGDAVSNGYIGADNSAFITLTNSLQPAFLTGDLGRYLLNGEIEFLGRKDDQIKRHGYRIEPGEIVAALQDYPGVADAAVITAQQQLIGAITPQREEDSSSEIEHCVVEAVSQTHVQWVQQLDSARFGALLDLMELAALVAMQSLRTRTLPIKPDFLPLMARWDRFLTANRARLAAINANDITLEYAQQLWQQARILAAELDYGDEQMAYVAQCLDALESVVSGETDPLALLFPEGQTDVARASYGNNRINQYLNQLMVSGIDVHARQAIREKRTLRLLEIGGGVGGTTGAIIDSLRKLRQSEGLDFEYVFTDISRFFLDEASRCWGDDIKCQYFDINRPFVEQQIALSAWDVVISANVLHNAKHIPKALNRLYALLVPGGDLAIIDVIRPNAALMVTMEFKDGLNHFQDERARSGDAFYSLTAWQQALHQSHFHHYDIFPPQDDADEYASLYQKMHQAVIWANAGGQGTGLNVDSIKTALRKTLTGYMVPDAIVVLESIPLTENGKVDRQAISQQLAVEQTPQHQTTRQTNQPLTDHQKAIADIWASVIGLPNDAELAPDDHFFDVGGDSLLLAKCIGQLRRTIPNADALAWDGVLRQVVADPSLANCSRVIWQETQPTAGDHVVVVSQHSPIDVVLAAATQSGRDWSGDVICFVHDGSGGLAPYHDVIEALQDCPEHPEVVGIHRTPNDGYLEQPAETLFETFAERYVEALLALHIRRVHLFGYCMGGLIAAVMAEKLTENGIDVKQLIVVSSYRVPFQIKDDVLLDYSLARLLGYDPAAMGLAFPEHALGALLTSAREKYDNCVPQNTLVTLGHEFPEISPLLDVIPPSSQARLQQLANSEQCIFDTATLQSLRDVYVASLQAVSAFSRPGYLGDITFLRQRGELYFLPTLRDDMTTFWQEYCLGELTVRDIEGTHFDCLNGDNAHQVVMLLQEDWDE